MKRLLRYSLLLLAISLAVVSLIIPLGAKQISKNKLVLADMKDRVHAVYEFQTLESRLPNQDEITRISQSLPIRYTDYKYRIEGGSTQTDWSLSFWRGDWNETYTSSSDSYTLEEQASWWGFFGFFLFVPFISFALFLFSRHKFLRTKIV